MHPARRYKACEVLLIKESDEDLDSAPRPPSLGVSMLHVMHDTGDGRLLVRFEGSLDERAADSVLSAVALAPLAVPEVPLGLELATPPSRVWDTSWAARVQRAAGPPWTLGSSAAAPAE